MEGIIKIFLWIAWLAILISCNPKHDEKTKRKEVQEEKSVPIIDTTEVEVIDSLELIDRNGRAEMRLFESKYERTWQEKPKSFPYSNANLIKVFQIDCSGECFKSEFKNRITSGTEISYEDFNELINLLNSPESYGGGTAACYDPKFALVLYDEELVPMEFLSICLDCNTFRTYPGIIEVDFQDKYLHGFNSATRKKLRKLFFKWGIDYFGFNSLYDNEEEYLEYLNKKNDTTTTHKLHTP